MTQKAILPRWARGALSIVSFVPLIWFSIFVGFVFDATGNELLFSEQSWFPVVMGLQFFFSLVQYGLIGVYVYLAVKRQLGWWQTSLWIGGLFMFHALALPAAWWFLAREPEAPSFDPVSDGHVAASGSVGC